MSRLQLFVDKNNKLRSLMFNGWLLDTRYGKPVMYVWAPIVQGYDVPGIGHLEDL